MDIYINKYTSFLIIFIASIMMSMLVASLITPYKFEPSIGALFIGVIAMLLIFDHIEWHREQDKKKVN